MSDPCPNIEAAVERVYALGVGTIGSGAARHERPHKPILLLTVLDLLATGAASATAIKWSQALRERFKDYFTVVQSRNDTCTPENPFLYLRRDGFWAPVERVNGQELPLTRTPTVADANNATVFGQFVSGFDIIVARAENRVRLRDAVVARYFPSHRTALEPLYAERRHGLPEAVMPSQMVREEPTATFGRNPAFRRKVLEVYDSQCAACGLRIKLPEEDLTFVDGAHLIPFHVSQNDHPTNGLALCKNHHWAMDRFLIVPTADGIWSVSRRLDARRSSGEQALCALNNQPVLPPHDDAFRPARESLNWRATRLV